MAAEGRSSVAGKYATELDGIMAGWVYSADGGHATSEVVNEKVGSDHIVEGLGEPDAEVHRSPFKCAATIWARRRLGLTFQENVPDLRNSRSFDLVRRLRDLGHEVAVADPLASAAELKREHGLSLSRPGEAAYDLVVAAVAHQEYRAMDDEAVAALVAGQGTIADLRGMWRDRPQIRSLDYWTL